MPRNPKRDSESTNQKQTNKKPNSKPDEVVWGGFINIKIDDETKGVFERFSTDPEVNIWRSVEDALATALKLGISWDSENQCFIATYVGAGVVGSNERYCLTARAGSMAEAVALLVFKDVIMCEQDWGRFKPRTGEVNNWG